jgi:two-component system, sensor histidine kinase
VNLVDNAIKFTPRGTVTLFMEWLPPAPDVAHGRLAVRVRDTGIGIPAEKVKDLFQMFMQADTSTTRRFGGTGLGLAICHRLVALMGGEISAQSKPGEGSEFTIGLPFAPLAAPSEAQRTSPPVREGSRPPHAPRVLVVDDLETNRLLLELVLRREGFEPDLAAGGEEAVRLATERHYDAILMDLQMPVVDGYTATQRIRAAESPARHTPIIALTASTARGTRERCLAAGMDDHMTKPLNLPRFRAMLDAFVPATR